MSLFDSIISGASEKFGLGNKTGSVLSALLSLMTDQNRGGFAGFLDLFSKAGLGDVASSWISSGVNSELSNEQVELALGEDTISDIASQADISKDEAASALAYMIPNVVDKLTPDGVVPEEKDLLSKIGDFLSGIGGAVAGAALGAAGTVGAMASGASDKVGDAASATVDSGKAVVGGAAEMVGDATGATVEAGKKAMSAVGDVFDGDGDGGGILKWLLPLILLGLALLLGFWFCSKKPEGVTPTGNTNTNKAANSTAKAMDSAFKIEAQDGKYTVTGLVKDEAMKKQIMDSLTAQFGAGNVNFDGLKVDAAAKDFGAGWWGNFTKLLPNLKDWKNGALAFVGSAITEAAGLPKAAIDSIKELFKGWTLPVSVLGTGDEAVKAMNEAAEKAMETASTPEEIVKALNSSIIQFASGKADIDPKSQELIDKAAQVLKKLPAGSTVTVGGHTDNVGDKAKNQKLSEDRSNSVMKALVAKGVPAATLAAKGYGDTVPKADNATAEGKFQNRRIEYSLGSGAAPTVTTTETKPTESNANAKPAAANANH